jgi:hypothetical protein
MKSSSIPFLYNIGLEIETMIFEILKKDYNRGFKKDNQQLNANAIPSYL